MSGRNYYACSVGEPGETYVEENFDRIIANKAFILHEDTKQKGHYNDIEQNDIILLKYNRKFVAYGEVLERKETNDPEWNLWATVKEWIFADASDRSIGVPIMGIQENALEGGGQMGTVKGIQAFFGISKISEINSACELYRQIIIEQSNKKTMEDIKETIEILRYKGQIILQGPPGTGKTRRAKGIAASMSAPLKIVAENIKNSLVVNEEFPSSSGRSIYTVVSMQENSITMTSNNGEKNHVINFTDIIRMYEARKWENGEIKGGTDAFAAGISKILMEKLGVKFSKLIQFHPAYSYEDFVRGISAKSTEDGIEYKTENKTLIKFANQALQNFVNHNKNPTELSRESWINEKFDQFKTKIEVELNESEKVMLTDAVYVYEVGEDCFRYRGKVKTPRRVNFKELKGLIGVNIGKTELDIPDNFKHAKWRTTYYLPLLQRFFLESGTYTVSESVKEELQNFILIIDEINRANLPAVLGELIYALEYRNKEVESMYEIEEEGNKIILPPNLFIIGTMNTADRSVGHIDYAIRRRFAFVDVLADESVISNAKAKEFFIEIKLFITRFISSDFELKDVMLGHSYFLEEKNRELKLKLKYEVLPILNEYMKDGVVNKTLESTNALATISQKIEAL